LENGVLLDLSVLSEYFDSFKPGNVYVMDVLLRALWFRLLSKIVQGNKE